MTILMLIWAVIGWFVWFPFLNQINYSELTPRGRVRITLVSLACGPITFLVNSGLMGIIFVEDSTAEMNIRSRVIKWIKKENDSD